MVSGGVDYFKAVISIHSGDPNIERAKHFFKTGFWNLTTASVVSIADNYGLSETLTPNHKDSEYGLTNFNLIPVELIQPDETRISYSISIFDCLVDAYFRYHVNDCKGFDAESIRSLTTMLFSGFGLQVHQDYNIWSRQEAWNVVKKDPFLKYFVQEIFSVIEDHDMKNLAERTNDEFLLNFMERPKFNVKIAIKLLREFLVQRKKQFLDQDSGLHIGLNITKSLKLFQSALGLTIDENLVREQKKLAEEWMAIGENPHVLLAEYDNDMIVGDGEIPRKKGYVKVLENPKQCLKVDDEEHKLFFKDYKKYIRVLSSCLSFTNCASRLTRVSKLYAKPMNFSSVFTYRNKEGREQIIHGSVKAEEFLKENLENNRTSIPLVIEGAAGMGKTVSMYQLALSYVNEIEDRLFDMRLEEIPTLHLPLFLKARKFEALRYGELSEDEEELDQNQIKHYVKLVFNSLPELMDHYEHKEMENFLSKWMSLSQSHNSSVTFFLDGIDECEHYLPDVFDDLGAFANFRAPTFIISTRPSHYDELQRVLDSKHGICKIEKGYYTDEELGKKMPIQLCDAWGITRESGEELTKKFNHYKNTLIHPLFVGWFCFLIESDKLDQIEGDSDTPEIAQHNLISTIINIGIESSLRRRESEVLEIMVPEEYTRLLRYFVAISFQYPNRSPRFIWDQMFKDGFRDLMPVELKKKTAQFDIVRESIEDCGILYLTGDTIDWTHRTIQELIYVDFMYNEPNSFLLGPMKTSEPILDRLAQLEYEDGKFTLLPIARLSVRHRYDVESFQALLSYMKFGKYVDIRNDSYGIDSDREIIHWDGDEFSVITESRNGLEIFLGATYLSSWSSTKPLPISRDWIRVSSNAKLMEGIQKYSNCPFFTDVLKETKEVWQNQPNLSKISSNTRIIDCFTYYRSCLLSANLSPDMEFFHAKAENQQDMFNISLVNRGLYLEDEFFNISSWFGNEWFTEEQSKLIKRISDDYVSTAYGMFFGHHKYDQIIDYMWNELQDVYGKPSEIGYSETLDFKDRLFIDALIHEYELHTWCDERGFYGDITPNYDTPSKTEKGILMMPFMDSILRSDKREIRKSSYLRETLGIAAGRDRRKVKKVIDLIQRFQKSSVYSSTGPVSLSEQAIIDTL